MFWEAGNTYLPGPKYTYNGNGLDLPVNPTLSFFKHLRFNLGVTSPMPGKPPETGPGG
jgi:hypothetical protein